jgi:hypothetical protein
MKFLKKRSILILSLVIVLTLGTFNFAYAYFNNTKSIINIFKAGTVTQDFTECFISPNNWNPGDSTSKIIHIVNTGTKAVYTRIKCIPLWNCNLPTTNVCYEPNNPNWVKIGDYFYYKKILGSSMEKVTNEKEVTLPLSVNFSLNSGNEYQGKIYTLTITSEVIQAKNGAINTAWGLTPSQIQQIGFEQY